MLVSSPTMPHAAKSRRMRADEIAVAQQRQRFLAVLVAESGRAFPSSESRPVRRPAALPASRGCARDPFQRILGDADFDARLLHVSGAGFGVVEVERIDMEAPARSPILGLGRLPSSSTRLTSRFTFMVSTASGFFQPRTR